MKLGVVEVSKFVLRIEERMESKRLIWAEVSKKVAQLDQGIH
jgi:hypothetical protein